MDNTLSTAKLLPLILTGIAIMIAYSIAFIFYFKTAKRRLYLAFKKQKDLEVKYQQDITEQNLKVQEEERKLIAQELHDNIGSKLNVLNLYVYQLNTTYDFNQSENSIYADLLKLLRHTIDSTRLISHKLIPPTLESFGLIPALNELADEISAIDGVDMCLHNINVEHHRLTKKNMEINIFRIIQELVNNSIKHNSKKIDLTFEFENGIIQKIEVKDDGPGYNPMDVNNQKGLGLKNIDNRLRMIEASMDNLSELGKGSLYVIKLGKSTL